LHLKQLITNVVANALDARPEGGILALEVQGPVGRAFLSADVSAVEEPGYAVLHVKDDGAGMDAELRLRPILHHEEIAAERRSRAHRGEEHGRERRRMRAPR
jgi:signal transduction histidine kinase